jgi:predicted ribosomally synthesized six-cysteine peptide SCIFF
MQHINTIHGAVIRLPAGGKACSECQSSCQSACKTSCTVANQKCENTKR